MSSSSANTRAVAASRVAWLSTAPPVSTGF
jgi:hypothetical protein